MEKLVSQLKAETDPFVKAKLMKSLIRDYDLRLIQLAKILSLKPAHLCHYLRLNRLSEIVVDGYYANNISLSHLFVISRLKDRNEIINLYEKVLTKNLTVLETEELVREILHGVKTEGSILSPEEKDRYASKFPKEMLVKIIQTRIKGKLLIEVKGSLATTTKFLRMILNKLTEKDS